MLLKDTHNHTKKIPKYSNRKSIIVFYLFLFTSLFSYGQHVYIWRSVYSVHSITCLHLMSRYGTFPPETQITFLLPALFGVFLLITDHLISKFCPLFFVSQIKEDSYDLFLYCLYLKNCDDQTVSL